MTDYLITGAGGFIGSHLVCEIVKNPKHRVIALVKKNKNYWRLPQLGERVIFVEMDFTNLRSMLAQLEPFKPKVLFHLAWEGVINTYKNDCIQYENQHLLQNVCLLAEALKVETIVGLGSQAEYGIKNKPIKETDSLEPVTLYGKMKVLAYHALQNFCVSRGMQFVWLRLFSSYGPMDNPQWLIPYLICSLLNNKEPLLTQGTQYWDYMYVKDIAKAILRSYNSVNSEVFNLGSGQSTRISFIVEKIYELLQKRKQKIPWGTRSFSVDQSLHLEADMTKYRKHFGQNIGTSIEEGLALTVEYYVRHHREGG